MAKKTLKETPKSNDAPNTLKDTVFFGLNLNDEQIVFRDAIYDKSIDIVLCEAKAGSGKTLIAVATAVVMYEYGLIDEIVYMVPGGVYESKQGYLPGTLDEKNAYMKVPLRQALLMLGYDPDRVIRTDVSAKEGAFITVQSDSYLRGYNIGDANHRTVLIVDEAQNYSRAAMKTVLSRLGVGSKAVVIGDIKQCGLIRYAADYDNPISIADNGFWSALHLYFNKPWSKTCKLNKCYRSQVAELAEEL